MGDDVGFNDLPWEKQKAILGGNAVALAEQVQRAQVESDEDAAAATDLAKMIAAGIRQIESKRQQYVQPLNQVVSLINEDARNLRKPLELAKARLETLLTGWLTRQREAERQRQEQARREQEAKALEAAQLLQDAGFKEDADKVVERAAVASEVATRTVRAESVRGGTGASAGLREAWQFELVDLAQVPVRFVALDSALVRAFMRDAAAEAQRAADAKELRGKEWDAAVQAELEKRLQLPGIRFYREARAVVR